MPSEGKAEIIIVGAGPAGLRAAIAAAQHGVSVLAFDKKTTIGDPVKCGEFLPSKEEMANLLPGARDLADLFEILGDSVSNKCDTVRMYSPRGKCWEFPFNAYVLNRVTFEQRLAAEARQLGVEFMLGRSVRVFRNGSELRVGPSLSESFDADVVIAADGFPSTVASTVGLADARYMLPGNTAVNYQYLIDDLSIEPNVTEMYVGSSIAPGGYAWIIPRSDRAANVGVGVRTTFMKSGKGKDFLDYFVKRFPLTAAKLGSGTVRGMITDPLPIDGAVSKTYSKRALLVGDAAGMVMATNGGGIPTAMISGQIAGEVAALHVQKGEPLSSYEARWKSAVGRELHASTRMRRFADFFMRHDRLYDSAMRTLQTSGIKQVVTCKVPTGVDILMKACGH